MSATPKTENNLQDNTPARQSVARDGLTLPYILGRGRAAVQWITPVLHWRYRTTKQSSYAYFSALGEVCLGPVDEIARIFVNGKPYSGVFIHRDVSVGDYIEHTLAKETPETFRFYWGTETQSAAGITAYAQSLVLNPGHPEASAVHPGYLGRLIVGVKDLEAGQAQSGFTPALPNVEIEIHRRAPIAYSYGHWATGTHPVGCIYEFLKDQRGGLGLPTSLLNSTHWNAQMDRLMTEGAAGKVGTDLFISPVVPEQREASQVLADTLAYLDGWLTYRNGQIEIDWYPNDGTTTDPTGLRELSWHDMIGEPTLDPDGLSDLVTKIAVTGLDYDDPDDPLCEATEVAQVPYAKQILSETRTEKINRPYYLTRTQLRTLAALTAQLKVTPRLNASAKFRRESCTQPDGVTPLRPGDRFQFDYTPFSLDVVCRILERTESDDKAEVTLRFVSERGASPQPYVAPLDPRATIELPDPLPPAYFAMAEAPPALELAAGPSVIPLAERANTYTSNYRLHFAPTNSWPGQIILDDSLWSISGVVTAGLTNVDTPGTLTLTIGSAEVGALISQGTTAQEDNSLLLYAGGEWLSVGAITPLGGGSYDVAVLRGRLGSDTRAISTTERLWFLYKTAVPIVAHENFKDVGIPYNGTTATKWFKLEGYTGAKDATITSAVSLQLANRAPGAVTGLTATGLAGSALIEWVYPIDDIAVARIYESTTVTKPSNPSHFVVWPTASFARTGLAPDDYYFWVELEDEAGNVSTSVVGPASATVTSGTAGTNGYTINGIFDATVQCDSAGTAKAGELGSGGTGRVFINITVLKGAVALTPTTGTPGAGQFKITKVSDTNCTTTYGGGYNIQLTTVSAPSGSTTFTIDLEGLVTTANHIWKWAKVVDGTAGSSGSNAVLAQITAATQVFTRANSAGTYSPSTIILSTTLAGATATTYLWQYWNGSSWVTASGTVNTASYTVASGDFSDARTYRCLINSTYFDEYSIYHVTGGTNAKWTFLTNESHTVPASSAGVVSSFTGAGGTFKVYDNDVDVTTSATFSIQTNTDSLTASIGASTGIYAVTAAGSWASGSSVTTITFRAAYGGINYDRIFTLSKSLAGAAGTNGAGYSATSTTSLALGTGSKAFTTQAGLAYAVGQTARLIYTTDPTQWMEGPITAYSGTSMTINAVLYVGSGTYASWTLTNVGVGGIGPQNGGTYLAGTVYYCNSLRFSVVYVGTSAYRAVNPAKDGLTTWGTPGSSSDWSAPDSTVKFLASDFALVNNQIIAKTLTMGDTTTADAGIIQSAGVTNYTTGAGYYFNPRSSSHSNAAVMRIGNPSGYYVGFDGTDIIQNARRVIIGDSTGTSDTVGDLQVVGEISGRKFGSGAVNNGFTTTVAGGSIGSPSATQAGSFAAFRLRIYTVGSYGVAASIRLKTTANAGVNGSPTDMEFLNTNSTMTGNQYLYFSSEGKLEFAGTTATRDNANLSRGGTDFVKCDGDFGAANLGAVGFLNGQQVLVNGSAGGEFACRNSGGVYNEVRWQTGVAFDVQGINPRVYTAAGAQVYRVDCTNGDIYLATGAKIYIGGVLKVS